MPYIVVRKGKKFCVVKETDRSKVYGCHPTAYEARQQQKAMYANEKGQ